MAQDIKENIGILAGKIWLFLSQNGQATTLELKAKMETSNTFMFLALGWLGREDKITISEVGQNNFIVSLK
jgi:hypothetical protein